MPKIQLTNGFVAVVDSKDFKRISQFNWYAWKSNGTYYAVRRARLEENRTRVILYMHREILGCPDGQQVDHQDRNGLNNTRKNLRVASFSQNRCNSKRRRDNTSGFKGVSAYGKAGKFRARIKLNGKEYPLGYFHTASEAYAAYCKAAPAIHKEFARIA